MGRAWSRRDKVIMSLVVAVIFAGAALAVTGYLLTRHAVTVRHCEAQLQAHRAWWATHQIIEVPSYCHGLPLGEVRRLRANVAGGGP